MYSIFICLFVCFCLLPFEGKLHVGIVLFKKNLLMKKQLTNDMF